MTEDDWLKAKDPDAMLKKIADRLSPRRWHLLACATVRRAWDAIPDGVFKEAVDWVEQHAGATADHREAVERARQLEAAGPVAVEAARQAQRQIVLSADPDTDPDDFQLNGARKVNPTAPLFQSACRNAGSAVLQAGEAADMAVRAVISLLAERPGSDLLNRVRELVVETTRLRATASLHAASAIDLKARGDEAADRNNPKKANLLYAASEETVRKLEEQTANKANDLHDQKAKGDRKAMGRMLLDVVGNPFKAYRFEPSWRTDTVRSLAKAIYAERAFDRMPILADALLDADCDEEAVLRHCRGTEVHTTEGPYHIRGCWVLDLILEQEMEFFAGPPLTAAAPPPPPRAARIGGPAPPFLKLFEAISKGKLPDDDDEED